MRIGKYLVVPITSTTKEEASNNVTNMCKQLLANTIVEEYSFDIIEL